MIWMPNLLTTRRSIMTASSESVQEASRPDHMLRNILFAIDRNVNAGKRPEESCQKLLNRSTEAVHTVSEILNILRTDAIVPASIYFSSTIRTLESVLKDVNSFVEVHSRWSIHNLLFASNTREQYLTLDGRLQTLHKVLQVELMRVSSRPNLCCTNNGPDGGSPSALVPSPKTMAPLPVSSSHSEPVFDSSINNFFTLELSSGYRSLDFTTMSPLIVKDDDHDDHPRDQRSSLITGLHEPSVSLQKDSHTTDDCWPRIDASKHSLEFATTKNDLHYPELIIQPYIYSSPTCVHITKGALNDIKHYQNSWAEASLQFNPPDTTGYVVLNNHPNDGSLPKLIKVDGPLDGNIRPDVDLDCYSLEYQETMPPYDLCPSTTVPYASFYEASLKN